MGKSEVRRRRCEYYSRNAYVHMRVNLATKCRNLLFVSNCPSKSEVHRHRCEYYQGNTDVHIGLNFAQKCLSFLLVLTSDRCIAQARVRSIAVDVSISEAILMFIVGGRI